MDSVMAYSYHFLCTLSFPCIVGRILNSGFVKHIDSPVKKCFKLHPYVVLISVKYRDFKILRKLVFRFDFVAKF